MSAFWPMIATRQVQRRTHTMIAESATYVYNDGQGTSTMSGRYHAINSLHALQPSLTVFGAALG